MQPLVLEHVEDEMYRWTSWPEELIRRDRGTRGFDWISENHGWKVLSQLFPEFSPYGRDGLLYLPGTEEYRDHSSFHIPSAYADTAMAVVAEFNEYFNLIHVKKKKLYPRVSRDKSTKRIYRWPKDVFRQWGPNRSRERNGVAV